MGSAKGKGFAHSNHHKNQRDLAPREPVARHLPRKKEPQDSDKRKI
jgi:hypothetical protein